MLGWCDCDDALVPFESRPLKQIDFSFAQAGEGGEQKYLVRLNVSLCQLAAGSFDQLVDIEGRIVFRIGNFNSCANFSAYRLADLASRTPISGVSKSRPLHSRGSPGFLWASGVPAVSGTDRSRAASTPGLP